MMTNTKLETTVQYVRHYPYFFKILPCCTQAFTFCPGSHLQPISATSGAIIARLPQYSELHTELTLFAKKIIPSRSFSGADQEVFSIGYFRDMHSYRLEVWGVNQ